MKLLFCNSCNDVFALREHWKGCSCGRSGGVYAYDGKNANISGPCIPVGFDNLSFNLALESQPEGEGPGVEFDAFVIPKKCKSLRRIGEEVFKCPHCEEFKPISIRTSRGFCLGCNGKVI